MNGTVSHLECRSSISLYIHMRAYLIFWLLGRQTMILIYGFRVREISLPKKLCSPEVLYALIHVHCRENGTVDHLECRFCICLYIHSFASLFGSLCVKRIVYWAIRRSPYWFTFLCKCLPTGEGTELPYNIRFTTRRELAMKPQIEGTSILPNSSKTCAWPHLQAQHYRGELPLTASSLGNHH